MGFRLYGKPRRATRIPIAQPVLRSPNGPLMKPLTFMLLMAATMFVNSSVAAESESPNVILIMADDLGYHDLSCYGHPQIKTPVIDQLARDGIKLTSFYAGATVCTPSRMALLTGCYPSRLGWKKGVIGHIMAKQTGLNPQTFTIAEAFKKAGYVTSIFGKWHLGNESPFLPTSHGFDTSYYIKRSNNQTDEIWRDDQLLEKPFHNPRLTEQFTREAISFVRKNKAKPFLLYLPYTAPHFPVEPHPQWKGKSEFGVYGDVVEEMDHRIGELLQVLEEEGLEKKTIVVFLSDNGPEPLTKESKADPYRGKKWSALEGGTRVPCIIRYPSVIPTGVESDAIIAALDLFPSLAAACGIELPETGLPLDGVNVWSTLTAKPGAKHPRDALLYWHGSDGFHAIRVGNWKLFLSRSHAELPRGQGKVALFNLADDPTESVDVSGKYPERVKQLRQLATARLENIEEHAISLGVAGSTGR